MLCEPTPNFLDAGKPVEAGAVFTNRYPFYKAHYEELAVDGPRKTVSWRPGVFYRACLPEDSEAVAHDNGFQVLTVVDVHKPGRYPSRVFFTQKWIDPKGREFGRNNLKIATMQAFKRKLGGYRFEYKVDPNEEIQ